MNIFKDPNAIAGEFRRIVLGFDTNGGGNRRIRGFPTWDCDLAVTKEIAYKERYGITLNVQILNVMNHFQPSNPTLNLDSPGSFGVITGQANTPRQMEFGVRVHF